MIIKDLRQTIIQLQQKGNSNRTIARLLKVSRNTIRVILQQGTEIPIAPKETQWLNMAILRELFTRTKGNAVRIQEILKEEYDTDIA